jgi:hypothetical protein
MSKLLAGEVVSTVAFGGECSACEKVCTANGVLGFYNTHGSQTSSMAFNRSEIGTRILPC